MGPRTLGLSLVLLGSGDHETTGGHAVVAGVALSIVLPVAFWLLRPRSRAALVALALVPWLALAPFLFGLKRGGREWVDGAHATLYRDEVARILPYLRRPEQVGYIIASSNRRQDLKAVVLCYRRLVELDPSNEEARKTLALAETDLMRGR
jgi:hypothetical protein